MFTVLWEAGAAMEGRDFAMAVDRFSHSLNQPHSHCVAEAGLELVVSYLYLPNLQVCATVSRYGQIS